MKASHFIFLLMFAAVSRDAARAQSSPLTEETTRELRLRSIGPAVTPGRVADVAVDPRNRSVWYVATASSGLWKTSNRGTTWQPIFDDGGSYSLGSVTVDPNDSDVVWLGTGENESQRSVGFGDGLYKSVDAGKTWKRVGLTNSQHIPRIFVHPRDSKIVLAAAEGPLWSPGGDRGLYKTTDGGETWKPVLQISENTGVSDLAVDPRNPDVIFAAAFQRRRHTGILIGGGPEGGIFKSSNGGASWTKLTNGLPTVDIGRIGLAISPEKPDVIYAQVTAAGKEGGLFRSEDSGETWIRAGTFVASVPEYYTRLFPDPQKFDRLYAVDSSMKVSENGGKTFSNLSWRIHSDHHVLVFDPTDANHFLEGNDDGLDESYDGGRTWRHFNNMPTTQFYRVSLDNALPFYNVYGGAQDNGSYGGPVRTVNRVGVRTADWFRVGGGDGFQPRVDPDDPSIVYAMSQSGGISRLDRRTDVRKNIKPRNAAQTRWNWDAPFVISPHAHERLYLAANRLYRSNNRGDDWTTNSSDLTRQIDRDTIPVMGRTWNADAVDKNRSTTPFGVASTLAESSLKEGLLFVGTDDGLIQISEDDGKNWRKIDSFPGVPELAYVSDVLPSQHDANTLYATFNNYQYGDFKPYVLKSTDLGKTWTSIIGDLPDRQFPWSIAEDHVNPNLLFVGTEFGLFFTVDGGRHWVQLRNGAPPIPFRELEIQRRENDLVAATFGRGFYVLDDYSALRGLTPETLSTEAAMLPLRKTYVYHELTCFEVATQDYTATNPAFGAALTYYLRDDLSKDDAKIVLTVANADGKEIRKLNGPASAGVHRVVWNLRDNQPAPPRPAATEQASTNRVDNAARENNDEESDNGNNNANGNGNAPRGGQGGQGGRGQRGGRGGPDAGQLVNPGKYIATLNKQVGEVLTPLGQPQPFEVVPLPSAPSPEITKPGPNP